MPRTYPNLRTFFKGEACTQGQLAQELDVSEGLLSMIKWGQREPDLELAIRITERCHIPLESLIKPRPHNARRLVQAARRRTAKARHAKAAAETVEKAS